MLSKRRQGLGFRVEGSFQVQRWTCTGRFFRNLYCSRNVVECFRPSMACISRVGSSLGAGYRVLIYREAICMGRIIGKSTPMASSYTFKNPVQTIKACILLAASRIDVEG